MTSLCPTCRQPANAPAMTGLQAHGDRAQPCEDAFHTAPTPPQFDWGWYASFDGGEIYTIGPCATRDGIIAEAQADGSGETEVLDGDNKPTGKWEHVFTIMEAKKDPIELADYFHADDFLGNANDAIRDNDLDGDNKPTGKWEHVFTIMEAKKNPIELADYFDAKRFIDGADEDIADDDSWEDAPDVRLEAVTPAMTADLETRVRETIRAWQAVHDLVITPWLFTNTRNEETVTLPCVNTSPTEGRA